MLIKQELINEYCDEGKSPREIAREKGYGKSTIVYYLKKYGIPTRTISEARKQLFKRGVLDYHGEEHPFYGKHHSKEAKEKMSKAKENYVPWNVGKKHTKEAREKMSKALSGENSPWWGREHKQETKEKIADAHRGKKRPPFSAEWRRKLGRSGEKNPNWKGGVCSLYHLIRSSKKYKAWAKTILTRDDFRCQNCRKRGGNLHAHHRYPFARLIQDYNITSLNQALQTPELWDLDIGITLCVPCHIKTFKKQKIISPFSIR